MSHVIPLGLNMGLKKVLPEEQEPSGDCARRWGLDLSPAAEEGSADGGAELGRVGARRTLLHGEPLDQPPPPVLGCELARRAPPAWPSSRTCQSQSEAEVLGAEPGGMCQAGPFLSPCPGVGMNVHPMYLGESAPKKLRGTVALTSASFTALGLVLGQAVGLR